MAAKRSPARPPQPRPTAFALPRPTEPGRDDNAARMLLAWARRFRPEQSVAGLTAAGGVLVSTVVNEGGNASLTYDPEPRGGAWTYRLRVTPTNGARSTDVFDTDMLGDAKHAFVEAVERLDAAAAKKLSKTAAREAVAEQVSGYGRAYGYPLIGGLAHFDPTIEWAGPDGQWVHLYLDSDAGVYVVSALTREGGHVGEREGRGRHTEWKRARDDFEARIRAISAQTPSAPAARPPAPALPPRGTQMRLFANPAKPTTREREIARVLELATSAAAQWGAPFVAHPELTEDRAGPVIRMRVSRLPWDAARPRMLLNPAYVQARQRGENPYGIEPMGRAWSAAIGMVTRTLRDKGATLDGKPARVVYRFEPGAIEDRLKHEIAYGAPAPGASTKTNPAQAHQHSGHTQTFIVAKSLAPNVTAARALARKHHAVHLAADETGTSWRFRQRDPSEFKPGTFRTYDVGDGVKVVVGDPRKTAAPKRNPPEDAAAARARVVLGRRSAQILTYAARHGYPAHGLAPYSGFSWHGPASHPAVVRLTLDAQDAARPYVVASFSGTEWAPVRPLDPTKRHATFEAAMRDFDARARTKLEHAPRAAAPHANPSAPSRVTLATLQSAAAAVQRATDTLGKRR